MLWYLESLVLCFFKGGVWITELAASMELEAPVVEVLAIGRLLPTVPTMMLRLLRDFDDNLFQNHPSEALRREMIRLEGLNKATQREWDRRQTQ